MTVVFISPSILDYQEEIARAVDQVRRENTIAGPERSPHEKPFKPRPDVIASEPRMAGLLIPPRFEVFYPSISIRDGVLGGVVQFWIAGDFGILDVFVSIMDDQGNLIESGYAVRDEYFMNHWGYLPSAEAGSLRSLTVLAIVTDRLGGMRMRRESTKLE